MHLNKTECNQQYVLEDDLNIVNILHSSRMRCCGEYKLIWSIFERAVSDLLDSNLENREDSRAWFELEEVDDPDVTSFQFFCSIFGFDIKVLRKGVYRHLKIL